MNWHKTLRCALTALCAALAALTALCAVSVCREGLAARAAGDTLGWIYTPERLAPWLRVIFPVLALTLALGVVSVALGVRAEEPAGRPAPPRSLRPLPDRRLRRLRLGLLAAALALIVAGVLNGSARDVLIKAINLCTECVGLG